MLLLIAVTRTVERLRFVRRIDHISINRHNWQSEHRLFLFAVRGVARIFSEVPTILQITLHPQALPYKKLPWLKIWLRCKPKSFFLHMKWQWQLMKYFVGCLGPLTDACQSSIIYIACVYTGYYHAKRLPTFPDSLLYFLILCPFRRF